MVKKVLNDDGSFSFYKGKSCAQVLQEQGHPNFQKKERARPALAPSKSEEVDPEEQALAVEALSDEELEEELKKRKALKAVKDKKEKAASKDAPPSKEGPTASSQDLSPEELNKLPVAQIKGLLDLKGVDYSKIPPSPKRAFVEFASQHLCAQAPQDDSDDL